MKRAQKSGVRPGARHGAKISSQLSELRHRKPTERRARTQSAAPSRHLPDEEGKIGVIKRKPRQSPELDHIVGARGIGVRPRARRDWPP